MDATARAWLVMRTGEEVTATCKKRTAMRLASWARDSHRIRARAGRVAVDHELVAADAQLSGENGLSAAGSAVIATEEFARKVLRPHPQPRVEAGSARIERMRAPNRGAELVDVVRSRIANSVRRAAG